MGYLCLPPHGGSGLKYINNRPGVCKVVWSPSPRREWIEISAVASKPDKSALSPSPRREWIEMITMSGTIIMNIVSLPTEGVD